MHRGEMLLRTGKSGEEIGDVDYVRRVASRIMVHLVGLARLVLDDVQKDIDS